MADSTISPELLKNIYSGLHLALKSWRDDHVSTEKTQNLEDNILIYLAIWQVRILLHLVSLKQQLTRFFRSHC